ncbi:integral membrane sensor signal transduction histidine kinase [Conexibacter woesei DSM 14684]|uniref:histidine kinase n=1 Tax=Conexibacter woesei (strain DSM 14684 / CCUG 47730 / CIP 108061 / JCM 11494 / NBRC 100937 / ID131577) TaxID=469383 RepID=D3F722_CONWI|nr:integral membrane sensor signal transduction histidine kinase [Conexibacter woesei DSM 14684]
MLTGCVALFMVACAVKYRGDDAAWLVALGVGLALVQGAVLPLRHARPALTAAVALSAAAGLQALHSEIVLPIGAYVAVGALAFRRPPLGSWWGLAGLAVLALAAGPAGGEPGDVVFLLAVAAAAWGTGELRRVRVVRQQEASRAAVAQEQARIARELHDVIAHSVSVIVVQATAADHVFDERPDRARAALRAIEATGRETLAELRRLLPALRPFDADDDTGGASLARLDELVARVRATGLAVTVRRDGPPSPLPAPVDLSAYRIVQEALTNTLRHAGATHAEVALRWEPSALELDVRDDGCGDDAGAAGAGRTDGGRAGGGRGTSGMRERAELLGGTLEAGPGPDGGYRVHARLPLEGAA